MIRSPRLCLCLLLPALALGCATEDAVDDKADDDQVTDDTGVTGDDGGDAGDDTGDAGDDGGDAGDDGGDDGDDTGDGGGDDGGDAGDDGGDDGGDGGGFDPCPAGVTCVSSFPYTDRNTTTGASSDTFDSYACASGTDESGPEVLYRVDLTDDGFLALDLPRSAMGSGADIDIHLLGSLDSGDCIDRGHWRAGAYVEAGSYYVVADTWVSGAGSEADGDYTLTIGFTSLSQLRAAGVGSAMAEYALYAYDVAWADGQTDSFHYAFTDFSVDSSHKRQWVLDLSQNSVEWNLYVAHGEASSSTSNTAVSDTFSNVNNSHQSSLGMVQAGETYTGTYGYSMRLDGLESGYNDLVRPRAIVVHPWQGSRDTYVAYWGETAETWGCPAIDDRISADVIDFLAEGSLLFFYYPDGDWSRHTPYLP